jgi:hypothetical protein
MTTPTTEKVPVAISDTVNVRIESNETIETSGFTFSRGATAKAEQLLSEDPARVRALIQADTIVFIGSRNQMAAINGIVPNAGGNGPGARLLNTTPFIEIKGTNELWIAYTAATEVGVVVERRVTRGR